MRFLNKNNENLKIYLIVYFISSLGYLIFYMYETKYIFDYFIYSLLYNLKYYYALLYFITWIYIATYWSIDINIYCLYMIIINKFVICIHICSTIEANIISIMVNCILL